MDKYDWALWSPLIIIGLVYLITNAYYGNYIVFAYFGAGVLGALFFWKWMDYWTKKSIEHNLKDKEEGYY